MKNQKNFLFFGKMIVKKEKTKNNMVLEMEIMIQIKNQEKIENWMFFLIL